MFDSVRNNRRIVQLFLGLITLPFAFWGVESYVRNAGAGDDVATVGGSKISQQEFQRALQAQQEKMRTQMGGRDIPAAALDNPELRKAVIDSLVNQRLLAVHAQKAHMLIADQSLAQFIASVPELQENGAFSPARYEALVAAQGMSKEAFEQKLRHDMVVQQSIGAVAQASMPGDAAVTRWLAAQLETRTVSEVQYKPEDFLAQAKVSADAVKTFYETNHKAFEVPEQVKIDFLVLDRQTLAAQAGVSDEEVKAWYDGHQDQYKQAEERRASHILITVAKDAPADAVKAAQAKIDDILAQVKKNPASFDNLAKQYSQDPGSAKQGGDLGWFGRGAMVKPFEDTAFSLKEGAISDVVRSDFGFHVIQVTGVHAEKVKPLADVKAQIATSLKEQSAQKKFAEASEGFSNAVYEQSDSLKPAAEKYHLNIQSGGWVSKGGRGAGPLANPKLQAALFSDDAIKNQRNTEAVEVAPGVLVAAHVVEHKPATTRPLDEVKGDLEKYLQREEAAKLARKAGEEQVAQLQKGGAASLKWGNARSLPRLGAQGVAPDAVQAVFKADVAKLPAYAGAALPGGVYTVYRIEKVTPYDAKANDERAAYLRQQYGQLIAGEEIGAWVANLRQRYSVEINKKFLEPAKDR
ncbi:MAG TPA: SurA N-terminal domain-containing protein [Rhodocyclaceae bacterium]|nr:SurA N-terminal domain-containing protein [Rhodocyclaceae bacterium]